MGRNHAGGEMEAKGWSPCATELLGRKDLDLWVDESSLGIGGHPVPAAPGVLQEDSGRGASCVAHCGPAFFPEATRSGVFLKASASKPCRL